MATFTWRNALLEAKQLKDEELNAACNEAILSGFDHAIDGIVYHWSFDTEAQLNYQGAERLLSKGYPSIDFTVFKDGTYHRIPVDLAKMDALTASIMQHKNRNVVKYRELLLPLVYEAQTVEEVQVIHWDMPPPPPPPEEPATEPAPMEPAPEEPATTDPTEPPPDTSTDPTV